jgi:hypothetical protein
MQMPNSMKSMRQVDRAMAALNMRPQFLEPIFFAAFPLGHPVGMEHICDEEAD